MGGEVDRLAHNAEPACYSTVDDAQGDWDTILGLQNLKHKSWLGLVLGF